MLLLTTLRVKLCDQPRSEEIGGMVALVVSNIEVIHMKGVGITLGNALLPGLYVISIWPNSSK